MKLKLVKSFWGMDGSLEEKMRKIAGAGYAAVEGRVAGIEDLGQFQELRAELGLDFVPMVLTEGEDHLADFRAKVEEAARFAPLQITTHIGRDHWSFDRKRAVFAEAIEIERQIGIPMNHETHRGRALFSAQVTAEILRELPDLWINADFSHFACVSESLLEDQPENLAICISRARHVHGRVGHEEGPQVSDPRAPEWAPHLAAHEAWWDEIVRARLKAGAEIFTFNPEFGPPNYMPTLPHTQQPVSDLWEICFWMAKRFEARYSTLVP